MPTGLNTESLLYGDCALRLPSSLARLPWELHPASVFLLPDGEICMKKRSDEVAEAGRVGTEGRRCLPINYLQQQAPNHLAQVGEPTRRGEGNMQSTSDENESGEFKVG